VPLTKILCILLGLCALPAHAGESITDADLIARVEALKRCELDVSPDPRSAQMLWGIDSEIAAVSSEDFNPQQMQLSPTVGYVSARLNGAPSGWSTWCAANQHWMKFIYRAETLVATKRLAEHYVVFYRPQPELGLTGVVFHSAGKAKLEFDWFLTMLLQERLKETQLTVWSSVPVRMLGLIDVNHAVVPSANSNQETPDWMGFVDEPADAQLLELAPDIIGAMAELDDAFALYELADAEMEPDKERVYLERAFNLGLAGAASKIAYLADSSVEHTLLWLERGARAGEFMDGDALVQRLLVSNQKPSDWLSNGDSLQHCEKLIDIHADIRAQIERAKAEEDWTNSMIIRQAWVAAMCPRQASKALQQQRDQLFRTHLQRVLKMHATTALITPIEAMNACVQGQAEAAAQLLGDKNVSAKDLRDSCAAIREHGPFREPLVAGCGTE
jgi:hypothetical protein